MEDLNEIENDEFITAPEMFIKTVSSQVNQLDVRTMVTAQKEMLSRLEKTNEMLTNYNSLSSIRLETVSKDFRKHTYVLTEMKKDLDVVFRKIRQLKRTLSSQYPEAFTACDVQRYLEKDENDIEEAESAKSAKSSVRVP